MRNDAVDKVDRRRRDDLVLVLKQVPHGLAERHEARLISPTRTPHRPQLVGA